MNEFVDTVKSILDAETGAGELLEGLTMLKNENAGLVDPCCLIRRDREDVIEQAGRFKSVEGRIIITILVKIDKTSGVAAMWENAEAAAETWARKVEKTIMRNPTLTTATYTNGFTKHDQKTEIISKEFGAGVEETAWWVFVHMTLRADYIYRDGTIALE